MVHVRERPPLHLQIEAQAPTGRRYRWALDEPLPENAFSGLRHSSTMPGGYESMDCELPRKPGVDYSDLARLSTLRVLGPGGEPAGEYRLERTPRVSGERLAVSPSAVGWQAHLEDDKSARQIYVDRDLSRWGPTSQTRRAAATGVAIFDSQVVPDQAGVPALEQTIHLNGEQPINEAIYDAGGDRIGEIYYEWVATNTSILDPDWRVNAGAYDDDSLTAGEVTANLHGTVAVSGSGTFAPADLRRIGYLAFDYAAALDSDPGRDRTVRWTRVLVAGRHGLSLRGDAPDQGLWASDVVAHAVRAWAPLLNVTDGADGTVRPSGLVIPHLVFPDFTTAAEIVRQASRFGLQPWGVWDNREFHWGGPEGRRWCARTGPAQLEETGPQVDRLWSGAVVGYQDVDGTTRTVGPPGSGADTESADLRDDDPENPANQSGIQRWEFLSMGVGVAASAIEVGRRFLEDSKLLDSSGRATLVGHVQDDRGVLHPYWKVRAGDYISFMDAADPSPRRVVKVDHSYDTRSCSVDLDAPPEGLQALLERLGVVLQPLGL